MKKAEIETIFVGNSLRNFTYLIHRGAGEYYCVDPFDAQGIEQKLKTIEGSLCGIINTHQHLDHICGNQALIETYKVPLYAHKNASYDRKFIGLEEGDSLDLEGENRIVFWDSPGHTMTHLSIIMEWKKGPWGILSGDTLFNAGVGHCKLGGYPEVLYQTMKDQYSKLDDEVEVYPGHEYFSNNLKFSLHCEPNNQNSKILLDQIEKIDWENEVFRTNMKLERCVNPFLRLDSTELRAQLQMKDHLDKEVFLKLRLMRNTW